MNSLDFSDSSDESDLDYRPPGEEEKLSEIDSDDVIEDNEEDGSNVSITKSKKNSKKQPKGKKCSQKRMKKGRKVINDEIVEKAKEEVNTLRNSSEEDKKRLDALWEEFQRPEPKKSSCSLTNTIKNKSKSKEPLQILPETTKKRNFEELFDSSDSSKKLVNNDVIITKPKSSETKPVVAASVVKAPGGLANILSQIGKKSKMTILEKSKQDWDGYKKKEGIVEELITHNKGKDGYLEKRDFLERTDLRQFELEKAMRAANRSHRS